MGISRFIVKPLSKAINQSITGSEEFDPLTLFANGEQGAWYDPSDLTTLYQDSVGTIPVTTDGDPVGLMLDKHLSLGDEMADPSAVYVKDDSPDEVLASGLTLIPGNRYMVSFTKYDHTAGSPAISFSGDLYVGLIDDIGSDRTVTLALTAGAGSDLRLVGSAARLSATNVSIKELPGNHATQSSSGLKPIYRTDGTLHWLEFDGFDDFMATTAYAQMSASGGSLAVGYSFESGGANLVDADDSTRVAQWLRAEGTPRAIIFNSAGTPFNVASTTTVVSTPYVSRIEVAATSATAYENGVAGTPTVITGSLQTGAEPLSLARRKTSHAVMSLHGLIQVNRPFSDSEGPSVDAYIATKSGVTL